MEAGFASGGCVMSVLCLDTWIEEAAKATVGLQDPAGATHHFCSQASDSMWRMPGHTEATKAVVSCDKPGGAAHKHYIPGSPNGSTHYTEGIVLEREPTS